MKKIYITGISGTGKTTISQELSKRGFYSISIDEVDNLCSWVNKETGEKIKKKAGLNREFTSKHKWLCDINCLKELINVNKDIIFVLGLASNQECFLDLFEKILLLQCEPKVFLERLKNRTNNEFGKDKKVQDHILSWYKEFENKMLERGATPINVDKPLNKVIDDIIEQAFL